MYLSQGWSSGGDKAEIQVDQKPKITISHQLVFLQVLTNFKATPLRSYSCYSILWSLRTCSFDRRINDTVIIIIDFKFMILQKEGSATNFNLLCMWHQSGAITVARSNVIKAQNSHRSLQTWLGNRTNALATLQLTEGRYI